MILITGITDREQYPTYTAEHISDNIFLDSNRMCYNYLRSPKWYWDNFCFYMFDNRMEITIKFYTL